ncbi:Anthranilate synthase component 2 [Paenibacillus sp. P1XP2]|nr:Anthranilate synthase component 2 [Paenibacillus sp. P1XP2]
MHGKTSPILHQGTSVFEGLPSPFTATRYHSLLVERSTLPDCLEVTAETEEGEIMGLRHKEYPIEAFNSIRSRSLPTMDTRCCAIS